MSLIFFKKWNSNNSCVNSSHSRSHSRSRSSSTGLLKLSLRIFLVVTVVVLSSTIVLIFLVHPLLVVNDCRVDGFIVAKKKKSPAKIISPLSSSSFTPLKQQLQQEQEQEQEQEQMDSSMDAPRPPPSSPRDEEEGINNDSSNYILNYDSDSDSDSNPTVFGKILRGELYRPILKESDNLIAFEDHKPKAKFHALIIPKRYIPTILDLDDVNNNNNNNIIGIGTDIDIDIDNDLTNNIATNKHKSPPRSSIMMLSLLEEMESTAETILKERYPEEYNNNDYILCFHIPPFTSVNHLHLHVLAPASQMMSFYRYGKYNCGSGSNITKNNNYNVRWCTSLQDVLLRLRTGLPPTPYQKDDNWTTILCDVTSSIRSILVSSLTR